MSKILLIDDMAAVRHAIATVLRKSGHEVVEAAGGQEGIEKCRSGSFDLVVTDIMMPQSDGTDVITALKADPKAPPVIAMSGGGSGVPATAALSVARQTADLALTKPIENDDLLNAVTELARRPAPAMSGNG